MIAPSQILTIMDDASSQDHLSECAAGAASASFSNPPVPGYLRLWWGVFGGTPPSAPESRDARPRLEPGERVVVRPLAEIEGTLDERRRHKGLYFMPEMEEFCKKTFTVMKQVRTIKLETTGEVRRVCGATVLLEGVYCDGSRHEGCDRASCLHLWREAWLERAPCGEPAALSAAGAGERASPNGG